MSSSGQREHRHDHDHLARGATLSRVPRRSARDRSHVHLWELADGTLSHAPPGELSISADGQIACHLCGRWFTHLGVHLRRHGWTAAQYREAVGLPLHRPLCSAATSSRIAQQQRQTWADSAALRDRFAYGQAMARSGELAAASAAANRDREEADAVPAAVRVRRAQQLRDGRQALAARQARRLADAITASGAADLHDLLRSEYVLKGASLESLQRRTGLGHVRLREELAAAGIRVRPIGFNAPETKRNRAGQVDAFVAARIGAVDLRSWLSDQRAAGLTMDELSAATGRSTTWVRARLAGRTTTQTA
jgi:hypothetical protein